MADRDAKPRGAVDWIVWFWLRNPLLTALFTLFAVAWGLMVMPFEFDFAQRLPRSPVAVDAIPDIGENQQIVFTEWPGRSPQDVDDQITYPLTVNLLGIPEVSTVRSISMFGFSSIFVIFEESAEFYWSRSRIVEKLNSLPPGALPDGAVPALGPDATALGQVYWYTLEGRDPDGNPAGGWDLHELRSIQDWYVRFALQSAHGVSEAASVGGYVREYQIDVDPDLLRVHGIALGEVFDAVRQSNIDVGARTIEVNRVEYVIRGRGFLRSPEDIEESVILSRDNIPVRIKDIAVVSQGPALRRGALDRDGAEAVGGVVVTRYGANPLEVIENVKAKIDEIAPGLPAKAVFDFAITDRAAIEDFAAGAGFAGYAGALPDQDAWVAWLRANPRDAWPDWVTLSQLTIVPFYDRTGLIHETLGTLREALLLQILITIIVVIVMVQNLRGSLLISAVLPLAVLMVFIAMKQFGVEANIVALSGIAIAIGTMVDMGIILVDNVLKHKEQAKPGTSAFAIVFEATREIGSAILTAVATTVVSFLPVFTMIGAEGKLFRPLAFTKTFALLAAVLLAIAVLPVLAHYFLALDFRRSLLRKAAPPLLLVAAAVLALTGYPWVAAALAALGAYQGALLLLPAWASRAMTFTANLAAAFGVAALLTALWLPLGVAPGYPANLMFVTGIIGGLLLFFQIFLWLYPSLLRFFLAYKPVYLAFPLMLGLTGLCAWLGFGQVFAFMPEPLRQNAAWRALYHAFPGFGREFMPALDEGSYLYMPTTMPHAAFDEALEVLQFQGKAVSAIPEVESVTGKIGRAESPLDPAPVSMIETVINYKPEYIVDAQGSRLRFRYDPATDSFPRDEAGELIPDPRGRPYRQWRPEIRSPGDIWDAIVEAADIPGTTSAPRLQPIAARVVMLQSGMRAPMGVKVRGPDLETIEAVGLVIEQLLRDVPGVEPAAVIADRIVGKPYIEIDLDRAAIARHGLRIQDVQSVIEIAIGGKRVTTTVEGRERYPVRVRYQRELRDSIESLDRVLVPARDGAQIPLAQLARIAYVRGPQMIRSEDTFLVGYVLFDKQDGFAEVDVVEAARDHLDRMREEGVLTLPAGVSYVFAGNYENQVRAQETLAIVLPAALFIIFVILFLQFRSAATTAMVFAGIAVAWSGGFVLMWLYAQPWFMDFTLLGAGMRELFQVNPILLSVAIWVGFLALFGIATDDGVVIATYLDQSFEKRRPETIPEIREAVVAAGMRRIRPCLMTTATTVLALLPVLTSTGRGADVMVPMAIPAFGGMLVALLTLFIVPVLYCWVEELRFRTRKLIGAGDGAAEEPAAREEEA